MSLLKDIWSVLTPCQRRWVLGAQLLSIIMAFSTVAGIASIAPFFAVLADPKLIQRIGILRSAYELGFTSPRGFTMALGLAFVGLVLLANLLNVIGSTVMLRLAYWISADLQCILLEEYLHRPYLFHTRTSSALLYNNVIQETTRATTQILQNGMTLVTNSITVLFITATVMILNPVVATGMVMALAGGYVLIYLTMRNRLVRAGQAQSRLFVHLTRVVNESLGAIKEINVARKQDFFRDQFARSTHEFARGAAHTQLIGQSPRYVMECVAVVGLVSVALLAGSGEYGLGSWLGQLTFLGFAAYRLLPTLQQVFVAIVRLRSDRPGFAAIVSDLRLARARRRAGLAIDPGWRMAPRSQIRFEDVSFRYGPERASAVNELSLRIPARAAVGLVGPNGSGKTTVIDLIAGLLSPDSGRIEVDGILLDDESRVAWQTRIAYVPQSIYLFDASIAQNIALGVPQASIDQERLQRVARIAQLDEFVGALPGGFDYMVGERGVRLSGGQRQRVGIARALYAEASVLMLDEATNALDGLTEHELMSTIAQLRGHYTLIVIAHRLSTVRSCDVIFELDQGKLVASGSYDWLLRNSGTFRKMARAADAPAHFSNSRNI
jgi:ATP-binding cassette, subfamily B, bacterial PglK